jgi:hypothetical protein
MNTLRILGFLLIMTSALPPCWAGTIDKPLAVEATPRSYARDSGRKGIVILSVDWDRKRGCGGFQNAALRELGFDRLPTSRQNDDDLGDLVLEVPVRLSGKAGGADYVFLVEPGEYALSQFSIKVSRSETEVGYIRCGRGQLISNGNALGGSFTVAAGEAVYIGGFSLNCAPKPTLWRYYEEGRDNFLGKMAAVRKKYPFLEVDRVQFRLFRTSVFGNAYELSPGESRGPG